MVYYFAPLEGITGYIFRNIHRKYFKGIDRYFAPFITPNESKKVMTKELRDLLPENNEGVPLVPQILTNQAGGFISTAKKLKALGYCEVNLNLGCPSGTVVAKNKGSGFLAFPWELERFLDEIFGSLDMDISIKTRLGRDDPEEFYELMEIYNKYPLKELVIHPRIRQDFYNGRPRMDYFDYGQKNSKNTVCYNGDLFTVDDILHFEEAYPSVDRVMLGRGLLMNPGLADAAASEGSGGAPSKAAKGGAAKAAEGISKTCAAAAFVPENRILARGALEADVLRRKVIDFHNELYDAYRGYMSGERNVLFKMKELWFYLIDFFPGNEKNAKKIKKAQRLCDYEMAVRQIFQNS